MIDYFDAIFAECKAAALEANSAVTFTEESQSRPSKFPAATLHEVTSEVTGLDSDQTEKFANVQYRLRVYSNSTTGKRNEAMTIFNAVDEWLTSANFRRTSCTRTPGDYRSSIYQIYAIYEATISSGGHIYTRR